MGGLFARKNTCARTSTEIVGGGLYAKGETLQYMCNKKIRTHNDVRVEGKGRSVQRPRKRVKADFTKEEKE